jgi:hypothetical protein
MAPPKSGGEGQLRSILVLLVPKLAQGLRTVFEERAGDGEADGANTNRLLERCDDIVIVLWSRWIEIWSPPPPPPPPHCTMIGMAGQKSRVFQKQLVFHTYSGVKELDPGVT